MKIGIVELARATVRGTARRRSVAQHRATLVGAGAPVSVGGLALASLLWLMGGPGLSRAAESAEAVRSFASPEQAVGAMLEAGRAYDWAGLRTLFGLAADELLATDRVLATNEMRAFLEAYDANHRLIATANQRILEVGEDPWPFPVPLVERGGTWSFDTAAGKEELVNRRVGRNELAVLEVLRVYVEAQREYASRDRDGDEVLEYAQHLDSAPGARDGLYWTPDDDGEISPLGPMVARAQTQGYRLRGVDSLEGSSGEPFHGYYFKLITRQGSRAAGGKYDYVINGNMIGGFALVAWPADYGESGVMTFQVNQQGRVYQQDLGPRTAKQAARMKAFDPGPGWRLSRE